MNTKLPIKSILIVAAVLAFVLALAVGLSEYRYRNLEKILHSEILAILEKNRTKIDRDLKTITDKIGSAKRLELKDLPSLGIVLDEIRHSQNLAKAEISGNGQYSIVIKLEDKYYLAAGAYDFQRFGAGKNYYRLEEYTPNESEIEIFETVMREESVGFLDRGQKYLFGISLYGKDSDLESFVKVFKNDRIEFLFFFQTQKLN
ncbi:hypothetical protein [Leptospira yasudae]|uniref:Uncharacterized protein n=1 Tax=Leptospira yasudae TaxID=2202201 RepID=A0A6N4QY07_9LEPT|nr:hypothetical protein [Leptospira yasudae]TGL76920.1 hypothetical protein EHQ72_12650 [Leptospira yasudae]TGL79682.1 hypothetical protein EHQ77_09795 [Leptospira yasudae]TGL82391.1 hypothetical protein EHQ83_13690 [Leptospira yasudae]